MDQMKRKHPLRKTPITPLTEAELQAEWKGISCKDLDNCLRSLKHDVSPGLGCMRNKHLLALLPNPEPQVTPSAAAVVDNPFDYANAIVKVRLPPYFYASWTACRLVPVNKVKPDDLPE